MKTNSSTKVWEESVLLPTYKAADPEKSPLFIENRAYQGSSGRVYPLPVTEKISDDKEDISYRALFLENEYLKVMILPELYKSGIPELLFGIVPDIDQSNPVNMTPYILTGMILKTKRASFSHCQRQRFFDKMTFGVGPVYDDYGHIRCISGQSFPVCNG